MQDQEQSVQQQELQGPQEQQQPQQLSSQGEEEGFSLGGKQWRSVLSMWLQLLKALPCQSASLHSKEPSMASAVMRVLVDKCVIKHTVCCNGMLLQSCVLRSAFRMNG